MNAASLSPLKRRSPSCHRDEVLAVAIIFPALLSVYFFLLQG